MKRWKAAAAVLLLLLTACGFPQEQDGEETGYLIYYLAQTDEARGGDLIRGSYEQLELPEGASLEEQATAVVRRLISGPEERNLRSPLPDNIRLLSLTIQDRRVTVDFSGGFAQLSGIELTLADYCLVLTLSQVDGVDAVQIQSAGHTYHSRSHQTMQAEEAILDQEALSAPGD